MGQEMSKHELFVEQLGQALKARGVKVKVKHLCKYFDYIKDLCPWFPTEGTINPKRWKRVGDALQDFYNTFGPEKVPVTAFSYWNLINDLLSQRQSDPVVANVVEKGQTILQGAKSSQEPPQDNKEQEPGPGWSSGWQPLDVSLHVNVSLSLSLPLSPSHSICTKNGKISSGEDKKKKK
uniref:Beta-retroviral matrix protein domain-containing protein n=1 Tax=Molossus molossus TaxID=27622 RepID=A0A7J8E351_MOLMO|nr:hypothetical protein HJG59_009065 [Molossus molossus]